MSTVEERLASLEARMDSMTELRALIVDMRSDMSRQFGELRGEITELRADTNRQFGELRAEVTELRGDLNRQTAELRGTVSQQAVELRSEMGELRGALTRRIDALDDKHDRHFTWLVGLQMALMVTVVGALVGAYYR